MNTSWRPKDLSASVLFKKKWPVFLILAIVISAIVVDQFVIRKSKGSNTSEAPVREAVEPIKFYRAINGEEVSSEALAKSKLATIMVENSSDAWPLSGLDQASIVYEVLAESRIPRFLAIFADDTSAQKIGPVRSVRPYFVELAKTFEPLYFHVGGSPDGLAKLKNLTLEDLDEFFWDKYYIHDKARVQPHAFYTSGELIRTAMEKRDLPVFDRGWYFKSVKLENQNVKAPEIYINYTENTYQAGYIYDKATGRYKRYQAKEPMRMENGAEIFVDTVIIEEHAHQVLDSLGRRKIDITGEGRAWVFTDGGVTLGKWNKLTDNDLTRYTDETGNEIVLNRGKIWINIVEPNTFNWTELKKDSE